MADFVACRIALCEGLTIPDEYYLAHPGALRMHDPAEWAAVLATLPPAVVAKVRAGLLAQAQEQPNGPRELDALELLRSEMELSGVFTDVPDQGALAMTG